MDPISRTVAIFTLVIVIQITVGNIRVDKCPTEEGSWIARASSVLCDETKGMSYHCIKDYKDELLEVCVRKEKIAPGTGGCPWVFVESDGTVIFGAKHTVCDDRNFCPDKNHAEYYTDQLYKYPGCIQSDYTTTSTTTKTTNAITTMTIEQNTIATQATKPNSQTIFEEVPYTILCVLMPILFICIEIWNIKKEKYAVSSKYKSESTPQNQTSQQRTPEDGRSDMTEQKGNEYVPFPSSQNVNNDKKDGVKPREGESDPSSAENGGNSPENRVHFWVKKHGFLILNLLVHSTLFVMFYAADISFYGKLFNKFMAVLLLLIILVFLGCVALVFILFKLDRDSFHDIYRKFIYQLFQLLALNCVLKYLVQTIFFVVQDESNDYIASIILFVCMVLFLSLHYFFHCKKYEIF